jgi:hypothetical protein
MPFPPTFTNTWDTTQPPDTQPANQLGLDIRNLKTDIMQRMSLLSGLLSNRPTPETVNATWGGSGYGLIYIATDAGGIYQWNGSAWVDITASFLLLSDAARVYRNSDQSIPNTTWTPISFSSVRYDNNSLFSSGDPTKLTCKRAGKYLIIGQVGFYPNATGYRTAGIFVNGTAPPASIAVGNIPGQVVSVGPDLTLSTIYSLSIGDYVTLSVWQNSGGALSVYPSSAAGDGNYSPEFMMQRLGP